MDIVIEIEKRIIRAEITVYTVIYRVDISAGQIHSYLSTAKDSMITERHYTSGQGRLTWEKKREREGKDLLQSPVPTELTIL